MLGFLAARENALANPGERRHALLAHASLVLCGLIWGSSFPQVKATLAGLAPAQLLTLRFGMTILLLSPLAWLHRRTLDRSRFRAGAACGLWLGLHLAGRLGHGPQVGLPPRETALGGLLGHLQTVPAKRFQPSNVHFGLMPGLEVKAKKAVRKELYAERGRTHFAAWLQAMGLAPKEPL